MIKGNNMHIRVAHRRCWMCDNFIPSTGMPLGAHKDGGCTAMKELLRQDGYPVDDAEGMGFDLSINGMAQPERCPSFDAVGWWKLRIVLTDDEIDALCNGNAEPPHDCQPGRDYPGTM